MARQGQGLPPLHQSARAHLPAAITPIGLPARVPSFPASTRAPVGTRALASPAPLCLHVASMPSCCVPLQRSSACKLHPVPSWMCPAAGTHCAGTIAAAGFNWVGVTSMAPNFNVKVRPVGRAPLRGMVPLCSLARCLMLLRCRMAPSAYITGSPGRAAPPPSPCLPLFLLPRPACIPGT